MHNEKLIKFIIEQEETPENIEKLTTLLLQNLDPNVPFLFISPSIAYHINLAGLAFIPNTPKLKFLKCIVNRQPLSLVETYPDSNDGQFKFATALDIALWRRNPAAIAAILSDDTFLQHRGVLSNFSTYMQAESSYHKTRNKKTLWKVLDPKLFDETANQILDAQEQIKVMLFENCLSSIKAARSQRNPKLLETIKLIGEKDYASTLSLPKVKDKFKQICDAVWTDQELEEGRLADKLMLDILSKPETQDSISTLNRLLNCTLPMKTLTYPIQLTELFQVNVLGFALEHRNKESAKCLINFNPNLLLEDFTPNSPYTCTNLYIAARTKDPMVFHTIFTDPRLIAQRKINPGASSILHFSTYLLTLCHYPSVANVDQNLDGSIQPQEEILKSLLEGCKASVEQARLQGNNKKLMEQIMQLGEEYRNALYNSELRPKQQNAVYEMFETLFTTEEELKLQKQAQKEFELISFREQNAISQIYEVFYTKEEQLRIQNKQTQKESLLVFSYVGKSTVILGSAYLFWNIINSGIEQSFNSISV